MGNYAPFESLAVTWIPAFAGMTRGGSREILSLGVSPLRLAPVEMAQLVETPGASHLTNQEKFSRVRCMFLGS
jgi:hypothetical protein